ncbi:hypothetical protein CPT_Moonbeam202 [Bacillus phage Moonbeam]|uniref:Uncharacterized protein n=1 Tax=Bacillus phage Moonbeam TaxID=1540091 RepID=A0A0A0RNC5_9CAUD|nr:hypothetical protein CPT_Moonbeam202 [Bacillus phage Moonbeam]AIW03600.1 hypothetical protein CPT_Moonbeam202 [Bacillus phage Moonbeam]
MNYTDAKIAIQVLHAAGYRKWIKGEPYYHKRWERGSNDYNQLISFNEIKYSLMDIPWIIQKYEEKAEGELEKLNEGECC